MKTPEETPTRILMAEDVVTDAELAQREILKSLPCQFFLVDTHDDYINALAEFKPDLIISDYNMPSFDGITALKLALESAPGTPVIILTAATNEDTAVSCMKAGAKDYVIKEHIKRLGQAVLHALEEKKHEAEKLEVEKTLRNTEERLKELADNLSSAFFVYEIDADGGRMSYLSPGVEKIWGIKSENFIDSPSTWISTVHPDDRDYIGSVYNDILRKPAAFDIQFRIINSQNETRWLRTKASPITDSAGALIRIIGVADDITERKAAEKEKTLLEQQLAQAQKLESVGRLAGGIAHDFNNMLSVIIGYSEIIKAKLPLDSPIIGNLQSIEKAALHSRDITRQLLAFSRKQPASPKLMNLNDIMLNTKKSLYHLIGEDIEIIFDLAGDLWNICFDPTQAEQILMNLVVNARDALPRGGRITIKTENADLDELHGRDFQDCEPGPYVKMSVTDNGIGMDAATLSHIFEPFFTTKETGKGTGLGLAMVYGIVKQNGGCISVESEIGKGAAFHIFIPRNEMAGDSSTQENEDNIQRAQGTILLVEDEAMLRQMVTDMLNNIGYKVISAASPREALSVCENKGILIDLLLSDVVMPEMNGTELRESVEKMVPGIKTLFISGYASDEIMKRGVLIEGTDFLQKPFSVSDLSKKIHGILEKKSI